MARESLELVRQAYGWLKDMHDKDPGLGPLYPGSGFAAKTHVQIAVRSPQNIKGFFRVTPI